MEGNTPTSSFSTMTRRSAELGQLRRLMGTSMAGPLATSRACFSMSDLANALRSASDSAWLSAYVDCDCPTIHSAEMDAVLLDFVAPFVRDCEQNGWVERYFF